MSKLSTSTFLRNVASKANGEIKIQYATVFKGFKTYRSSFLENSRELLQNVAISITFAQS